MRLTALAERAIRGLVRGSIQAGGWQRVLGEAVIDALQPPPATAQPTAQMGLWIASGGDLPDVPWRVRGDDRFHCAALRCSGMTAIACVTRQLATDRQRTREASRGQGTDYPHCDTRTCAQGRAIRSAMEPAVRAEWIGAGPGGRFERRAGPPVAGRDCGPHPEGA